MIFNFSEALTIRTSYHIPNKVIVRLGQSSPRIKCFNAWSILIFRCSRRRQGYSCSPSNHCITNSLDLTVFSYSVKTGVRSEPKTTAMLRLASLPSRFLRQGLRAHYARYPSFSSELGLHANLAKRGLAQAAFERTKPHLNVGTIGHVDHGKVSNWNASPTSHKSFQN